jgi:murein DD-endopeptidase MepM/ murein hydrolase activator NlpD
VRHAAADARSEAHNAAEAKAAAAAEAKAKAASDAQAMRESRARFAAEARAKAEARKLAVPTSRPAAEARPAAVPARAAKVAEPARPVAVASAPATEPKHAPVAKAEPAPVAEPKTTASLPKQQEAASSSADKADFRWPARGRVISGFSGKGGNEGINIAVPDGTPVKATEDGTVAYAGSELKGYGNLVLIRHPNGYVSAYAHNGELKVKRGDVVKRGQVVASSGQSGNVSSPQLHFELRKGSTPVDPTPYLNN